MQITTSTSATLLLMAIYTAACTTVAPEHEIPQTATAAISKPVKSTYTEDQVQTLKQALSAHRRTLYSSSNREYSYFIGGVLRAVYTPSKNHLMVTAAGAADKDSCVYDANSQLMLEGYAGTSRDLRRAECDALLSTLESSLATP